jgi:hypothetical protein
VTVGYWVIHGAPNQVYEQALARVVYGVAEKIDLTAFGGVEFRQYESGLDGTATPVWNLGGTWRPWEQSTLTLSTFQRYYTSTYYLGEENYLSTGVTVSWEQRIREHYTVRADFGYYNAKYESTVPGGNASRDDNVYTAGVRLQRRFGTHWMAGIFYDFQEDNSNLESASYNAHRAGVEGSWTY